MEAGLCAVSEKFVDKSGSDSVGNCGSYGAQWGHYIVSSLNQRYNYTNSNKNIIGIVIVRDCISGFLV